MTGPRTVDDVTRRLSALLGSLWETADVVIAGVRRLTGGASRETWAFDACVGQDRHELILRVAPTAEASAASLRLEAAAMRAAGRSGVPVPTVHAVGLDDGLGAEYMVMERCRGETIPRRVLREQGHGDRGPRLAEELGGILAAIHRSSPGADEPWRVVEQPVTDMVLELGQGRVPPAGLAVGLRWLRDHQPAPREPCLVHGDFRLGNLLVDHDGVVAVLDWEMSRWSDPVEDLGWLCAKVWRFGGPGEAAGLGSRDDLLRGYAAVSGWRPGDDELDWWEMFATVRWGLMCAVMADRHLSGRERSVELVAIGRRAAEQEHDVLLQLLGESAMIGAPVEDLGGQRADEDVFGEPSADDLLEGVHHYLTSGPMAGGGATAFHARVASNVVAMVRRELAVDPAVRDGHRAALARRGFRRETELSQAILEGRVDICDDEVTELVRDLVRTRLSVANPRHAQSGAPAVR